ncbi:hypothetical protein PHMEG_00030934 [Phytophthora megakarya]|uniref:DUF6570 domain-containing protein n=1 Tax=Phytophthora megakarya TaxID=4795 RepID=A0A225V0H7_9STRA|nr:hypothetical protein PHMEG_00030934 [Phytophthora megakarya]
MVGHHVDAADVLRRVTGERKVAQRLRRQRQFETQGRQADKDTHHHNTFDNELSADERAACLERLRKDLGAEGLDECVCVSCDRLVLRKHTRRVEDTDLSYLQKMKKLLSVDTTGIPEELVNMFCPPRHLTVLSGASVSPRGIQSYTGDDSSMHSWMSVCSECDKSIQRGKLSKFAIGNGFFVGCLSKDLLGLTIPERLMTQLAHITALTRVMRGGRHRCIRSHCIAFDCKPGPPVCLLPRMMNNVVSYRVLLVGEFTTQQAAQVRRMHRVRQQEVRDLFAFYMQHNHLYAGVKVDNSALSSEYTDDDIEGVFVEHVDDPECSLDNEMNREQESVHGESDAWHLNDPHDECRVIERRLGLVIDKAPVSPAVVPTEGKEREFEIRRSTQMANDVSKTLLARLRRSTQMANDVFKTLLARLFPHLFPFGRGHPGEDRKLHVSVEECIKHYVRGG